MSKARDLANAGTALTTVSATELGYVDGVTSAIQTQLDAKTAKSTLTTTGDIYYASAANTPARLGIGTASQLLAVNSGATAPEWVAAPSSGSMTLLSTTSLTGSSVTVSSISQAYKNLYITITDYYASVNQTDNAFFRINNDSNANRHLQTPQMGESGSNAYDLTRVAFAYALRNVSNSSFAFIQIPDYSSTSITKRGFVFGGGVNAYNTPNFSNTILHWAYNQTTAVSSINFTLSANNFSGGTVRIYGVN
jgi:hypothetical protein